MNCNPLNLVVKPTAALLCLISALWCNCDHQSAEQRATHRCCGHSQRQPQAPSRNVCAHCLDVSLNERAIAVVSLQQSSTSLLQFPSQSAAAGYLVTSSAVIDYLKPSVAEKLHLKPPKRRYLQPPSRAPPTFKT